MTPFQEADLLNEGKRKAILDEMLGEENLARKMDALRAHEIYRDKNKKWVLEALSNEGYQTTTLAQMANRAANISIARKIVNKLAVTYNGGVDRKAEGDSDQKNLDAMEKSMDANAAFKKTDRYRQLFHNCLLGALPMATHEKRDDDDAPLYKIAPKILAPWEYDVIEDANDPTKPAVIVIADFPERTRVVAENSAAAYLQGAQGIRAGSLMLSGGDSKDQVIADSPEDKGSEDDKRTFIWWSMNYHFTTNRKGQIVSNPDNPQNENPIKKLPWVSVAQDQDGNYWAQGGQDLIDGSILINKLLTDINYIAFVQGWGQLVISAKELPKTLQGGPDRALLFEVNEGGTEPQVFYASSNPPIEQWLETMKTYLALLLSTNDLSPRSVSGQLDVSNAASGVALMIDSSELMSDLQDNQQIFQEIEPCFWAIVSEWINVFKEKKSLVEEQADISPLENPEEITLIFHEMKPPISEEQRVKVLKDRKDLGLNTMVELVMKDNPNLTEEQAEEKVEELQEEKLKNQEMFGQATEDMKGAGLKAPGDKNGPSKGKAKAPGKPKDDSASGINAGGDKEEE